MYCKMLMLLTLALISSAARAATITVTNLNDSGAGSLRDAIATGTSVPPGDSIVFQSGLSGTITLASELVINKPLTITGPAAGGITISGNNAVRCFHLGESIPLGTSIVTISNLTLLNGLATGGSTFGGGLRVGQPLIRMTLNNITFSNCASTGSGSGGGLQVTDAGLATINNCTFNNNSSVMNGGGANIQKNTTFNGCTFTGNTGAAFGGGVATNGGQLTLINCTFTGNATTAQSGGAVFARTTSAALHDFTGCTFNGNTGLNGGAIMYEGSASVTGAMNLTNCTLSANNSTGTTGGAALMLFTLSSTANASVVFTYCTLNSNTSPSASAGTSVHISGSTGSTLSVSYHNTIIAGTGNSNMATSGTGTNTLTSLDYNICSDATGNLVGTHDKPSTNPMLGALADNGGATLTHLPQTGSPAIDAAAAVSGVASDQRGFSRPIDNGSVVNATGGDGSDIGAIEVGGTALPEISVTRSGLGTQVDDGTTHNFDPVEGVTLPIGFVIANTGPGTLTITGPVVLGSANNCSVSVATTPASSVAAGNSTTLAITLSTPAAGPYSFTVSIPNNDPSENPYNFTVSGNVLASGSNGPGSADTGGCTTAETGAWAWAAIPVTLALLGLRRRRRA